MKTQTLKQLALSLPLLFITGVLFGFALINPRISLQEILLVFAVLSAGALIFTIWIFRLIERREVIIQHRSEQLAALYEASLALTQELDLGSVLQRVVEHAQTLVGAKYGALGVLNESGEFIDQFMTAGLPPEDRGKMGPPPRGLGLLGVLIREGESIRIPDIASDPRAAGFPPRHPVMQSLIGVPIRFKGEILGNLYLTDKLMAPGEVTSFSTQDQQILEMFATQAAIAIKNAQLYRQSQQLTLLQERERFGMDLHDGVIQSIYAVGLMLEDIQFRLEAEPEAVKGGIAQAIEGLNDVIRDIRSYILNLRPHRFQGRDLAGGLQELARELRSQSFLHVEVSIETEDLLELSPEHTVKILHIAQEALTNVRKHARANRVDIHLARPDGNLSLAIADNGQGFDPDLVVDGRGNGLQNMRERAQVLGGEISFRSRSGGGTRVELLIPFDQLNS